MKRFAIILFSIVVALAANFGANAKAKRSHAKGKRTITTQTVKKAYLNKIYSLSKFQDDGYFLTDITGDGIPELWVKYGTCEADYMLDVYTYTRSGLKRILHTGASHTGYYGTPNGNYVIAQNAHMGYEVHTRITYSRNKLREKIIYESPGEVENYKDLSEPIFNFTPFNDTSAIYLLF